jgi:hypothetical protein
MLVMTPMILIVLGLGSAYYLQKKEDIALVSVLNSVISIHYLLINSNAMNRLL